MTVSFSTLLNEANKAAEQAANNWLANASPKYRVVDGFTGASHGALLDLCGNAHLCCKGNTKLGRYVKAYYESKGERVRQSYKLGFIIPLNYSHRMRQEHGLHMAAVKAAKEVIENAGFVTGIWDYID